MSIRHRVAKALASYDHTVTSYSYEVYGTAKHAYFYFLEDGAAEAVSHMLRIMLKRKPLIHNGRKPR
jgi:hypothetical protein